MALTTVTTVTGTGQKWPVCSCGWTGTRTNVPSDAYREKAHHERTHAEPATPTSTRVRKP